MRTDVKLGVVVAMVVVTVAGGYYMYRDRAQQPILIAGEPDESAPKGSGTDAGKTASKKGANPAPRNTLAQGTKRQGANQRLNQPGAKRKPAAGSKNAPRTQQPNRGPRGLTPAEAVERAKQKRAQQQLALQRQKDAQALSAQTTTAAPKLPPVLPQQTPVAAAPDRSGGTKPVSLTATTPSIAAVEKHRVQPGDTLSSLAVQYYGSERHTRMLIEANKQLANPDHLKIGEIVNLPAAPAGRSAKSSATKTSSVGARSYTVRSGDSFYVIAQSQLGDATRWKELYELNRTAVGSDPSSLNVGQVLKLPAK